MAGSMPCQRLMLREVLMKTPLSGQALLHQSLDYGVVEDIDQSAL